ncbi:MAG: DUF1152 domain-containing protein [Desulfurococcales archaeon]|nr:DUF1152 domain-containing protein [Desulfurococcales archaeon]MCE4626461.1 DUF1152 domain-containing protein [Desulfurococcales archaeon]
MEYGSLMDIAEKHDRILVFGAGGGGDALGTVHLYLKLKKLGVEPVIGSIVWERHPVDPYPGPIPIESLLDAEPIGWSAAIVSGRTVAYRYGIEVKFQLARVIDALGVEGLFIDASKGVYGVSEALKAAHEVLGVEAVIALDTGGDILAVGCEDNLWSPLADAISLAGMKESGLPGVIAVHGPGADGELPTKKVLEYISIIASRGGLIEVLGLSRYEVNYISKIMEKVYSESSKLPVYAFKGEYGIREIRGKTRRVELSPITATTHLLQLDPVYEWSEQAKAVAGTRGIGQAKERLNKHCIVTELDLELELSRLKESPSYKAMPIDEVRRELRRKLMRRGCVAFDCKA